LYILVQNYYNFSILAIFFKKKYNIMFYMVVSGVYVFWKLFVEPKKISRL
jgi:hypothetical protein